MSTIHLTIDQPVSPAVKFAARVSLGAQNFECVRSERDARRAGRKLGVSETWIDNPLSGVVRYSVEVFAPTLSALQAIAERYLREFPKAEFETRFDCAPEQEFDGWVLRGERLREPKQ